MSEKNFLTKTLNQTLLTRRSFLKWSAALGGTAALAGGLSYGLKAAEAAGAAQDAQPKWVTVACWHNCGGRCLLKAQVQDGVVTRIKSDDTHPDSPDFPQQRACVRGHSQRMQVFGADRLKYPMKRAHWQPGGGDKSLRGKDDWVRISWDEALDIVASELKNTKDKYGNEAILAPGGAPLLNAYGGAWETWGMVSSGAWPQPVAHMAGRSQLATFYAEGGASDRMELRNSKLIVLWGANPAWSSAGNPAFNYLQAKKAGAKIICVDPMYHATAIALADEWIPVRPSTDTALLLGMAYYMIQNNLQDQQFLDKYTVGFDAGHMPEGADPKGNFRDYVLGTYDGVPKTPEWASEICGTDPRLIRSFAQEVATTKPAALLSAFGPARTYMGEQFCQAFLSVGWMTGNVGIPGGMVADNAHSTAGNQGNPLVMPGATGVETPPNPVCGGMMTGYSGDIAKTTFGIVWDEAWDAVVNGEFTDGPRGKRKVDIHLIYLIGENAALNQHPNVNKGIEAFRKVDFVVSSGHFLTTNAKYSDVVLPATTQWEREGALLTGNREILIYGQKAVDPLFEAKDDATSNVSTTTGWVEYQLAQRLGLNADQLFPLSLKQQVYNQLSGATVVKPDGSGYEPLLTITSEDIAAMGVQGKPQQGRISYQEFKDRGIYQVPRSPDDNLGFLAYKAFRQDPVANPLKTVSGKLQIFSQTLSDTIKSYGWTETTPTPTYRPPLQGYEDTFSDWKNKVKGNFPLQFWTPHYMRRAHSVYDNVTWLREAFPQELWINPVDAEQRGIKSGDTVLVTSPHGKALRHAKVTPAIIAGAVAMGEGAWAERDDATGIDKAGATNSLSGTTPTGQGVQPWNTNICQVEKWQGDPLQTDYTWPQRIPLKEA